MLPVRDVSKARKELLLLTSKKEKPKNSLASHSFSL